MPAAAEQGFTLDTSVGIVLAGGCALVAGLFLGLLLAPRFLWPDRFQCGPEPPREQPDWKWPWLLVLPPMIVVLQLIAVPLRWSGVRPNLWLAFGVSMGSGAVCVALAWALLCRRLGKPARALGLKLPSWRPHLVLLPLLAYPLGLTLMFLAILFQILVLRQPVPSPQASMMAIRSITNPALRVFAVIAVAVVAPIAEETLFRGVLFRGLRFRWGFVAGMVVSAAVFAAAHLDLQHAPAIFMLGMVLAFVAEESRSLYPGMALHAMVNGVALWVAWKIPLPV